MKNPYANKDGSPINGKESLFLDWGLQESRKKLEKLPEKIKKNAIKSAKNLRDRMES